MASVPETPINLTVRPTVASVLVDTTRDALIIIKGCIDGIVPYIHGRPPERERHIVIASGNVFVYEETVSGIKRWTDSISWSPSRAFTNMLVYREVKNKFKPGSRKVLKKPKTHHGRFPYNRSENFDPNIVSVVDGFPNHNGEIPQMDPLLEELEPERRKHVVGSLTDSYEFKPAGLCKKTLSVKYNSHLYHIVGYYVIRDVVNGALRRPVDEYPELRRVDIRELISQNAYKFDLDSSGYYSSNPMKGEDENFPGGELRQNRDYSVGYDSPSSDIDIGLQSMNMSNLEQIDHGERQLPPLSPQDAGHGVYQFPANSEWQGGYLAVRNHFPQQQLPFSPPIHQPQQPTLGENNFFLTQQPYPQLLIPSNQQPRSMPDDSSFGFDSVLQYARPAGMKPNIPSFRSSTNRGTGPDLSQYRIGRRDENENENAPANNPSRSGTALWSQVLIAPSNGQSVVEDQDFSPVSSQFESQSFSW